MKSIGLYFGSFNPIHTGHLIIAEFMATHYAFDEVWFVISPQNPFKEKLDLEDEEHRAKMVDLAIGENDRLKTCTLEFNLPRPSYTIDTLDYLKKKFADTDFSMIMGEDNAMNLHHWKAYKRIINEYPIYVYPRIIEENEFYKRLTIEALPEEILSANITVTKAPIVQLSSTSIRKLIGSNQSIKYLVPKDVEAYIYKEHLYLNQRK